MATIKTGDTERRYGYTDAKKGADKTPARRRRRHREAAAVQAEAAEPDYRGLSEDEVQEMLSQSDE